MAKGDDEKVAAGIKQQSGIQQQNAQVQTDRTNQANDAFYGSPQQQAAVSGNNSTAQPQGQTQASGGQPPAYDPKDEKSVDAYLDYMGQQPGVNPSVKNDRAYWKGKMMADTNAGGLGPDANYVKGKMMTPEGAPAGSNGSPQQGGALGTAMGQQGDIMSRATNFADTGGFSPADLANIRARAVSPVRAVYANAMANLNRQRAIQGGYSPGFSTATGRMAREQGQATADAGTNAESSIAQMVQQGKLGGIGAMTSGYGATPGLAKMVGDQALGQENVQLGQQSSGQNLTTQQQAKANAERGSVMNTVGGIAKIGGAIALGA
jgi:hypothetical protein